MTTAKRLRLGISIVTAIAIVIIGICVTIAMSTSRSIDSPIENQLVSLQKSDFQSAYDYMASTSKNTSTLDKFKRFVLTHPVLANNKAIDIISRQSDQKTGMVKVILTSSSGIQTPATYRLTKEDGAWKISYITLSLKDSKVVNLSDTSTTSVPLPNVYQNERYSFTINYPDNWDYRLPNNKSIIFSDKSMSAPMASTFAIKPVLHQGLNGKYKSVNDLMTVVMNNINTKAKQVSLVERGRINLPVSHGERLDGRYMIVSYTYQGQPYKQMEVVYYLTEDRALYAIEYQAPAAQFDATLPIAKAMVQSFIFE